MEWGLLDKRKYFLVRDIQYNDSNIKRSILLSS